MINLHERMLPTLTGVEPATSWSPVGRASNCATEAGLDAYWFECKVRFWYWMCLEVLWKRNWTNACVNTLPAYIVEGPLRAIKSYKTVTLSMLFHIIIVFTISIQTDRLERMLQTQVRWHSSSRFLDTSTGNKMELFKFSSVVQVFVFQLRQC